ncbi:alanine racemase [Limnobacter parvus]|uniref:Alanine racemase n=1 Tax=Limnobacter parvus TaxID=2939690 RepID=A0ABT1XJU2_9BURK|nr:alanine racemase [Limnobacter parvus]MCR2747566.1 alanine racemase [Limnobacter parvus]
MPRPIRAVVNPTAILGNVNKIKQLLGAGQVMPVVKANAYGHGLERVLEGLKNSDALAILEIDGAARLRQLGWTKPIVLLEGCFDEADLHKATELHCDWVVHNQAQLEDLEKLAALNNSFKPRIFLKMNTGMNRLGLQAPEMPAAITWLDEFTSRLGWPTPVLMTHFANADEAEPRTRQPMAQAQFNNLMRFKPAHWQSSLGNSAGSLNFPELAGDIARPGIAVYGATPGPHAAANYGLKPAMTFISQIIAIQHIEAGDRVGYGSRWQADRAGRIAVVACGYADGYPRHAPDGTPTFVEGHVAPVVGRVSMDMMTIDITSIPDARVGSAVELWGEHIPVDVVADRCGTIGYELLCAIAPRVPFQVVSKD